MATTERHFGETTDAEEANANRGKCTLPCNHAVCPIYGTKQQVWTNELRADGRRAYCEGCSVERLEPCLRNKCEFHCDKCIMGIGRTLDVQLKGATPGYCGQKHGYRNLALKRVGSLETEDCDIPAIEPKHLPTEPFLPVLENNRGWMSEIVDEHRSWATTLKMIYPRRGQRGARQIMGVPEGHFFTMNFHVRDIILEELWSDAHRDDFWDWLIPQFDCLSSVNYSVFSILPRFTGFLNMKRSLMTYKELTERGASVILEWPDELPAFMDLYMQRFADRNGIWGVSMNMQTYKGLSASLLAQLRRLDKWWDPQVAIFAYGLTTPTDALRVRSALKRHDKVFFGNANVYTRSVYFDLVPGVKASRKRFTQGQVFAENVRRWNRWLD